MYASTRQVTMRPLAQHLFPFRNLFLPTSAPSSATAIFPIPTRPYKLFMMTSTPDRTPTSAKEQDISDDTDQLSPAASTPAGREALKPVLTHDYTLTPRKGKRDVLAPSPAGVDKSSRRTPKTPTRVNNESRANLGAGLNWQQHCVLPEHYEFVIRIYKCLVRPSVVAGNMASWTKLYDHDVWKHAMDPEGGYQIPNDAVYIIISESLSKDCQALFWARKLDENLPTERYELQIGCYYTSLYSLYEWIYKIVSGSTSYPLVEPHEAVRISNWVRFLPLYRAMTAAIDAELNWRAFQRRPYYRSIRDRPVNGCIRIGLIRTKEQVLAARELVEPSHSRTQG